MEFSNVEVLIDGDGKMQKAKGGVEVVTKLYSAPEAAFANIQM